MEWFYGFKLHLVNAWWKIQKWKIFSGFSVMGGTHDKRWFDTDVPRINWRVLSDYLITG